MTVINTNDKVTFERKEPLTGAVASTSPAMTVAQATAVADRAAAAFPAWSRTTPAERRRLCVALACLIGETQAAAAKALIDDATERGAKLLTGGELEGNFMRPAVLDNVTPDMRIYYEETFGPAACIVRARDAEHALEIANDSEYGLSGSIFTSDVTRALELTPRWETGIVHINGPTLAVEAHTPYGGVKDSGYGRFGGPEAIREFTDVQLVTVNRDQHYPF